MIQIQSNDLDHFNSKETLLGEINTVKAKVDTSSDKKTDLVDWQSISIQEPLNSHLQNFQTHQTSQKDRANEIGDRIHTFGKTTKRGDFLNTVSSDGPK